MHTHFFFIFFCGGGGILVISVRTVMLVWFSSPVTVCTWAHKPSSVNMFSSKFRLCHKRAVLLNMKGKVGTEVVPWATFVVLRGAVWDFIPVHLALCDRNLGSPCTGKTVRSVILVERSGCVMIYTIYLHIVVFLFKITICTCKGRIKYSYLLWHCFWQMHVRLSMDALWVYCFTYGLHACVHAHTLTLTMENIPVPKSHGPKRKWQLVKWTSHSRFLNKLQFLSTLSLVLVVVRFVIFSVELT